MRCSYCGKVYKPMSVHEYMESKEQKGESNAYVGHVGHISYAGSKGKGVHAGNTWNEEQTMQSESADHEEIKKSKESQGFAKTKEIMQPIDCMPGVNKVAIAMMSSAYFRMHAEPITEYSCVESKSIGTRNAIMKATLLGLLVGMGFNHEQAHLILDRWEKSC